MNMRPVFSIFLLSILLLISTACERSVELAELGHQINAEDSPVLLGAVVAGCPLRIYASSVQATPASASAIRRMSLHRSDGRVIAMIANNDHYFGSAEKLMAGESFTLVAASATGSELVIPKTIPKAVHLQTATQELATELVVEARLSSADKEKYYVLEIHQEKNGKVQLLRFMCDSPETDNARYNELSDNAERLFLHTMNDQSTLRLRVHRSYIYGNICLRVQSVDAAYYQYLYRYEVQKYDTKAHIEMPRAEGYLGIIGAATEDRQSLPNGVY